MYIPHNESGEVRAYNVYDGSSEPACSLKGHMGMATAMVQRRSNQDVITAGKDGLILVWTAQRRLLLDEDETDLALSRDDWSDDEDNSEALADTAGTIHSVSAC